MFSIGLTGGIGSGKTTVADMFAARGVPVIDTDLIAHQITAPGGIAMPLIEGTFGIWFKPYDGSKEKVNRGRIQWGPQFSYVDRNTWSGAGGDPHGLDAMIFTSFRYYLP